VDQETFRVGSGIYLAGDSTDVRFGAVFEEDNETGYFYALELPKHTILDALHIYNIANVVDRDRPSTFSIVWSDDGSKCALLINNYPHGAFDFVAQRGYCRTNFPSFPRQAEQAWQKYDHSWSDDAVSWLVPE